MTKNVDTASVAGWLHLTFYRYCLIEASLIHNTNTLFKNIINILQIEKILTSEV